MQSNNYTYIDAFNELQDIVSKIESGDVNVDDLAQNIQRATQLITICKTKLTATEQDVETLLKQLKVEETANIDDSPTLEEEEE